MHQETLKQTNGAPSITSITTPVVAVASFPHAFDKYKYTTPFYHYTTITVTALWVATPFLSTISVATICVAISTNQWLLTQENIKNDNYTGRGDQEYYPKNTVSGLWTLCYTKPGKEEFICSYIEYFSTEEYSPDLKDSTMAIPYTVTKSAAFLIFSTFLLFLGEFCCLFGHFSRQRRLFTFISGVIFIISGLLMLIGLVMYISIFKAEVGGKLRATSQLQPPVFTYKYGFSFILFVVGFVFTEISGTCAVFLYIYLHQKEWKKKGYDIRQKLVSPDFSYNIEQPRNLYPLCTQYSQNLPPNETECEFSEVMTENCAPFLQRRFYLEHNHENVYPPSFCLRHSMSHNTFNKLISDMLPKKRSRTIGTDNLSDSGSSISPELCQHHLFSTYVYGFIGQNYFPQDASTNTVSNWEDFEMFEDNTSSSLSHEHDFVPFDLENPNSPPLLFSYENYKQKIKNEKLIYENLSKTTFV